MSAWSIPAADAWRWPRRLHTTCGGCTPPPVRSGHPTRSAAVPQRCRQIPDGRRQRPGEPGQLEQVSSPRSPRAYSPPGRPVRIALSGAPIPIAHGFQPGFLQVVGCRTNGIGPRIDGRRRPESSVRRVTRRSRCAARTIVWAAHSWLRTRLSWWGWPAPDDHRAVTLAPRWCPFSGAGRSGCVSVTQAADTGQPRATGICLACADGASPRPMVTVRMPSV